MTAPVPQRGLGRVWWFDVPNGGDNEGVARVGWLPPGYYVVNADDFWHGPHATRDAAVDYLEWADPEDGDRIVHLETLYQRNQKVTPTL